MAALTAERDRIARAFGIDPATPPPSPDPQSILGTAMLVRAPEQRDEALAGLMREGSTAIYRESGRRRN